MIVHESVYENIKLARKSESPISVDLTRSQWTWGQADIAIKCDGMKATFSCSVESLEELAKKMLFVAALEYEKKEEVA